MIRCILLSFYTLSLLFVMLVWLWVPPVTELYGELDLRRKEKGWRRLDTISRYMVEAVILSEDAHFRSHPGIDLEEMFKSYEVNKKAGYYKRGGSTITQQLIKMRFLSPDKTIHRKIREVIGALLLEQIFTKNEIIEYYLNIVPFGNGQNGVQSAARYYYRTDPDMLTPEQSINLAILLPRPDLRGKKLLARQRSQAMLRRFRSVARYMLNENVITYRQYENLVRRE